MAMTDAQRAADAKYKREHVATVSVRFYPADARLRTYVREHGGSTLLKDLARDRMKADLDRELVESGRSSVFDEWHRLALVSADAFLDALDWVRADPRPDGMRTRVMGLSVSPDMDRKLTAELGGEMYAEPYDESGLAGRIELLTASYSPTGEFVGLYRRHDGSLWSPCEWAHTPTVDATTDLR